MNILMIQNQETQNALLQEVNKLQFINNDLSQQLNACDQRKRRLAISI